MGYLDKRDKGDVKIHMIGMQDRDSVTPRIFIKLYYKNSTSEDSCITTDLENHVKRGMDCFVLFFINSLTLKPNQYQSLSHVTITTDKDCKNESDIITIQTIEPQEFQYNFGMCLHKSIGPDFKPKVLLDWVKLNVALGAELITIYLQTGAEGVYDILLPYINKGIVEILDWKLEPPMTNGRSYHYGQTGVIVECLWRNMYRVRYLGLDDVDEFFIPLKHNSIPNMLTHIETLHKSAKPVASFVFTNTLLKDNGTILPVVQEAILSISCPGLHNESLPPYFKRTKSCLCFGKAMKKMILRPESAYIPWVHFLITYRSKLYTKEFSVPDDVGLSYHYRPNWKRYNRCSVPLLETRAVEKFFKKITNC